MKNWMAPRAGTLLSILLLGAANAQAQNLVQNPGFDGGFGGWTTAGGMNFWDGMMGNAAPGSAGSFVFSPPGGTNAFVVYQCVPATSGNTYDVEGSFRFSSGSTVVPIGSMYVTFFADPMCAMSIGGASSFQTNGGMAPAYTWLTAKYPGGLTPPAGTAAVRVNLAVFTFGAGTSTQWFDDIKLALSGDEYFTVDPCRVVDTRGGAPIGGPALDGQQSRFLPLSGHCGIPATAKSVSVNIAVTQPTAAGNVRLFPDGQSVPTVSSINYTAGQTRGNNAIVPLGPMKAINAFVGQPAGTTVHLILDVNGYFE